MIWQAAIIRENDTLFLVATMDYTSATRKSTDEEKMITSYVDLEKTLLKALVSRGKTTSIPSKVTLHGADYYYHLVFGNGFIFLALTDSSFSYSSAFAFLEQVASEFFQKSESDCEAYTARPYSLMKLEPWLQDLRKQYNLNPKRRKTIADIYAIEIVDILPYRASGLVRKSSKHKMATFGMWETRTLISLCLIMCLLDIYSAFDLCLQWCSELRQTDESASEKIESTLVIFSHYGLTILLGLLSPVYLLLASIFHLRQPISSLGKLIVSLHTWILLCQLTHVFLFEKNNYQKPESSLTTLQTWATLFDSFSIPILVVFLKLILLQVVIAKGYFAPLSFQSKKEEKYN